MKNLKRAYRRHKKQVKFIKRVKKWVCQYSNKYRAEYVRQALKGEAFLFLRTTSNPCNCSMCTYLKYKRTPKHKVVKEAFNE